MILAEPSIPRTIVLLGIGHTNAHVVKEWARKPIENCRLICISTFPTATYSGMLPSRLGWQFTEEEMVIDLQVLAGRSGAELVIADVCEIDHERSKLLFTNHDPIRFDASSINR